MRSSITTLLVCTPILLGVMVFVGCNQSASTDSAAASRQTVNAICPIMGGDVSEDAPTVEWNGEQIGFCCPGCDEKWEKLSDEEKSEKLAAAKKKPQDDHDQS